MNPRDITICNKLGLHARAAAKLVSLASGYASEIVIEKDGHKVNAKSIMGVMMLAASKGTPLRLSANGPDALEALEAIEQLIKDRFGERE